MLSTIVTMVESQPNKFFVVPAGLPVMVTNYKSLPSQSQNSPNIPKSLTQVSNHGDGNPGNPGNRPNGQSAKDQPSSSISNNNKYKQYKYNMFIVCLYNNIFAPPQNITSSLEEKNNGMILPFHHRRITSSSLRYSIVLTMG
jgi:hypothetical protein